MNSLLQTINFQFITCNLNFVILNFIAKIIDLHFILLKLSLHKSPVIENKYPKPI